MIDTIADLAERSARELHRRLSHPRVLVCLAAWAASPACLALGLVHAEPRTVAAGLAGLALAPVGLAIAIVRPR